MTNSRLGKLVLLIVTSLLISSEVFAVELQPGQGLQFAQIDFNFPSVPAAQLFDTNWGQIVISTKQLRSTTGIDRGYVNIFTNAGWTVQNLRVHSVGDGDWLTTYFDLQVPVGTNVTSISARVAYTAAPTASFSDGVRNTFSVSPRIEDARAELEPTTIGSPPTLGAAVFTSGGNNVEFINSFTELGSDANNYAAAGAIAGGLEAFRNKRNLLLPYQLEPDVSGVNLADKIFRNGFGLGISVAENMAISAMGFADEFGLGTQLSFAHQGSLYRGKYGPYIVQGITSTDFSVNRVPTFQFICDRISELDAVFLVVEWPGTLQRSIVARAVACGETLGQKWIKLARDQAQDFSELNHSDRNVQFFHVNELPNLAPQIVWGGTQIASIEQVLAAHMDIAPTNPKSVLWQTTGPTTAGSYGTTVVNIGDLTGDNIPEYAAGAPYDANGGNVRIVNGATNAVLTTLAATTVGERFGQAIATIGDITGDGVPDFAIGAYRWNQSRGAVRVYSGANFSLIRTHSATAINAFFGSAVAGGRDVNLDGVPDLVVGAPGTSTAVGYIEVYSGQTGALIRTTNGPGASSRLGQSVLLVPDMNNDSQAEVVAGAWNWTVGGAASGSIFVYSGQNGAQLFTANGGAGFRLGFSIANAGDVNRDGFPDIVAGIPGASTAGSNSGGARIFSGANLSVLYNLYGLTANTYLGEAVAGGFYHNFDGYPDVAVGAALASGGTGLGSAGNVLFYSGRTGQLLATAQGAVSAGFMGTSIAALGDVNGDAVTDYVFGSPGAPNGGTVITYSGENLTEMGYGCSLTDSTARIFSTKTSVPPGTSVDIRGINAPPNAAIIISYALATQTLAPLPGGCTSMADLSTLDLSTTAVADQYGNFSATITMPTGSIVNLARLVVQAVALPTGMPLGVDLSNSLLLTIK